MMNKESTFEEDVASLYTAEQLKEKVTSGSVYLDPADLPPPELCSSTQPEYSDWKCYLFGGSAMDITWNPYKGKEPNWFWRKMQYLILGNRWVKEKE